MRSSSHFQYPDLLGCDADRRICDFGRALELVVISESLIGRISLVGLVSRGPRWGQTRSQRYPCHRTPSPDGFRRDDQDWNSPHIHCLTLELVTWGRVLEPDPPRALNRYSLSRRGVVHQLDAGRLIFQTGIHDFDHYGQQHFRRLPSHMHIAVIRHRMGGI